VTGARHSSALQSLHAASQNFRVSVFSAIMLMLSHSSLQVSLKWKNATQKTRDIG
jgi:hypothetical protein